MYGIKNMVRYYIWMEIKQMEDMTVIWNFQRDILMEKIK